MGFLVRFGAVLLGLPLAAGLLLLGARRAGTVPTEYWINLNLPAASGRFLQALALSAAIYALWLLAGSLLLLAAHRAEHAGRWRAAAVLRRCSPRLLRTLALSCFNAGLLVGAPLAPALADSVPPAATLATPQSEAAQEPAASPASAEIPVPTWTPRHVAIPLERTLGSPAPRSTPRTPHQEVIVQAGDTLWDLARTRLGPGASISDVAAYWPRIHAANRQVIGEDPNLLQIGTVLLLPTPAP